MAALTVLQACAFATGAKFTAIAFAVLGNAFADFEFAIAIGMSTNLFSHDLIPPTWEEAVLMPLRGRKLELSRSHCLAPIHNASGFCDKSLSQLVGLKAPLLCRSVCKSILIRN